MRIGDRAPNGRLPGDIHMRRLAGEIEVRLVDQRHYRDGRSIRARAGVVGDRIGDRRRRAAEGWKRGERDGAGRRVDRPRAFARHDEAIARVGGAGDLDGGRNQRAIDIAVVAEHGDRDGLMCGARASVVGRDGSVVDRRDMDGRDRAVAERTKRIIFDSHGERAIRRIRRAGRTREANCM